MSDDVCYICHDTQTDSDPFLDATICKCRGSIHLHRTCFFTVMKHSTKCSICKESYKCSDASVGIYVAPLLDKSAYHINKALNTLHETELNRTNLRYYTVYNEILKSYLHGFSEIDNNEVSHGLLKMWWECPQSGLWYLYCTRQFKHGKIDGVYKQWTTLRGAKVQALLYEQTFTDTKLNGPFKEYSSKQFGRLVRTGCYKSSVKNLPQETLLCKQPLLGQYTEWDESGKVTYRFSSAVPCTLLKIRKCARFNPVRLTSLLHDGPHIISYSDLKVPCIASFSIKDGLLDGAFIVQKPTKTMKYFYGPIQYCRLKY
jgi:hypothetical protein